MGIHSNPAKGSALVSLLEKSGHRLQKYYDSKLECVNIETVFIKIKNAEW